MRSPIKVIPSIGTSGVRWISESIPLVKARQLSITTRCTFNASATAGCKIELFYSPDGTNIDTDSFAAYSIAVSQGNARQESVVVNIPEHGYIHIRITNNDESYTLTNVKIWYSIGSWEMKGGLRRGDLRQDTGEDI